ncbi:MAG: glycosyltransferase [Nitrospirales bacterium]|nr:glycosyltransferase [Nitrospirales bacterium]
MSIPKPADFYLLKESVRMSFSLENTVEDTVSPKTIAVETSLVSKYPLSGVVQPRVSVIVAAYNAERFMRGALEDLEAQTIVEEIEIIIVETGSQTEEYKIITEFQARYSNIIYVRTSKRMNPAAACNLGIRMARGQYITLGPTDDRRRIDALEVLAAELDRHQDTALVYGDVFVTNFENQRFATHIRCGYHIRPDYSPEIMLSGCHMGPQAMWRKSLHEEVGYFDETLESATDYEFWCRVAERHPMKHLSLFLGLYYENPKGIINSNQKLAYQETLAVQQSYRDRFPSPRGQYINNFQYQGSVQQGKFVNIGMVTYNRLDFTKSAIASLLKYTCYPHKLTIVDNGSSDGTQEYLKGLQKEGIITHLILLENNIGIAKASNLAWSQEPNAEYYLKLDNDIVIQKPNWLSNMVEVIDRIPELGAVAYNFEPVSYPVKEIRGMAIRLKKGTLGGACILIPKRTHEALGFWCEDYGFYGEEDADYGLRIMIQGLHNAYMKDEEVGFHLPAGRAAHIDEKSLRAADGIEEETHAEYRAFKDECRRKNVNEVAKKNWDDYRKGSRPLYCSSTFVQEFQESLKHFSRIDGLSSAKNPAVEQQDLVSVINSDDTSPKPVAHVSVILTDPICGRIRLLQPFVAGIGRWTQGSMAGDVNVLSGESILPTGIGQIWICQRTCLLKENYLSQAQKQGTRLVHDCDDLLWAIPADNPNHFVITPQVVDQMFRLMKLADCVTVSTEPIHIELAKKGIAAQVLPNSLVRQEWETLIPQRRAGSRPRVGWVGQAKVHKGDTAILETIIEALKDEVEWVFLGDAPRTARGPGVISETFSMVDLSSFPKKLASLNLDLALAPLVPNHFNEAKSDIRILQYGILGYPVIGTDIFPHQQAPILRLAHEPQAWIKAIRERIHDLDALEREGNNLKQWVLTNRLMEYLLPKYERAWLGRDTGSLDGVSLARKEASPISTYTPQHTSSFDCSIIIPVFNKGELTQQCLSHLAEVTNGCSYEVIVVDNASTDGTKAFLSTLGGDCQIITNEKNYGFAKACNQGVEAAKGRYLVFLNNDTIPKPGWLKALVDEVHQHSNVAIVGSKLLYPDETIQHAGVVFSKNCLTPYHLFRGAPGDLKAANTRREYQVVTAACMLIRRDEFEAVGGFDEIYQNGFEDVDLCLKVGKRGKQIIYQPQSVLYHLEHQTPGRKDPEVERHNGKVLMERWASSIVIDEDLYTVPEGYANRYYFRDGWLRQSLEPFRDEAERLQWEKVRKVQELLLRKLKQQGQLTPGDQSECESLLNDPGEWPLDGEVLRWGVRVCQSMNLGEGEAKFFERILSLGEDVEAREALAKKSLSRGNAEEASRHIHAILSQNPNSPTGHFMNGIFHIQRQAFSEAIHSFQKALAAGADRGKTQKGLGMAYMGLGSHEKAWETFSRLREVQPDDPEVIKPLLQVGSALGCWDRLAGELSQYLDRNPADCEMRYALAGVYFRAGVFSEAQEHCEILGTLMPGFEGLQDLRTRIAQASPPTYAIAK